MYHGLPDFASRHGSHSMSRPVSRLASVAGARTTRVLARGRAALAILAAISALGGCEPSPPVTRAVAEIVTHQGATFIVVEPQAYYLRLCDAGSYPLGGDPDAAGLRAIVAGADAAKRNLTSGDAIPWSTIASISFAEPVGKLGGEFCDGPQSIAAAVRLKDGSTLHRQLIDTTDRGIEGKTAQGDVVIPIRDIARLKMIADGNWAWAANTAGDDDAIQLRITRRTGEVREAANPQTALGYEKRFGDRALSTPVEDRWGFPAVKSGARILIPWRALKAVEIRIANDGRTFAVGDAPLAVHLLYADGHAEDAGARDGGIGDIPIDDIARIDVAAKPRPKPT
jgi:hypothetical protein